MTSEGNIIVGHIVYRCIITCTRMCTFLRLLMLMEELLLQCINYVDTVLIDSDAVSDACDAVRDGTYSDAPLALAVKCQTVKSE